MIDKLGRREADYLYYLSWHRAVSQCARKRQTMVQ